MFGIPNMVVSRFASHELDHFFREFVENRNIQRQFFSKRKKIPPKFEKEKSELRRREGILR